MLDAFVHYSFYLLASYLPHNCLLPALFSLLFVAFFFIGNTNDERRLCHNKLFAVIVKYVIHLCILYSCCKS